MKKKLLSLAVVATLSASIVGCGLADNVGKKNNADESTTAKEASNDNASSGDSSDAGKDNAKKIFSSDSVNILDSKEVSDKVDTINKYIDYYYYFDIDQEKQEESLYDGIMAGLDDPYSVYYSAEEFSSLQEESSGEYVGIGAVVTQDKDMVITVVRPIKGSPAEEAGLLADDVVVEVDGESTAGQELSEVVKRIRGESGTKAHVKVYRKSVSDYLDFDITRRVVENYSVSNEMIEKNIGYIQVEQFYENTGDEFKKAIEECQSKGAEGLIIDLRDNPGGLLDVVVDMCEYIMEDITIVSTKDKNGKVISSFEAKDGHSIDIPMVVLVNGNSASASEIFAGAMKDSGKAKLVGVKTFGKGIVQSVIPLEDGSAIKLTVAKYFTPNGTDIHKIGIEPDYEVELKDGRTNAVNLDRAEDTQLTKGLEVLKGMMK